MVAGHHPWLKSREQTAAIHTLTKIPRSRMICSGSMLMDLDEISRHLLPHCYQNRPTYPDSSRSVFYKFSFFGSVGSCWVRSVWLGRIPKPLVMTSLNEAKLRCILSIIC